MFKEAIIKLTAWYVAIIMIVSLSFSTFMYLNVVNNTKRALEFQQLRIERRLEQFENERGIQMPGKGMFKVPDFNEETLLQIREQVFAGLLFVNIAILFISSFLGYFLAKKTLNPINNVMESQKLFISNAAHDLKTPLTAIKTNLEVNLRNKKLSTAEAKKIMQQAIEEVDNLNYFTNKLLKQSKYSLVNNLPLNKFSVYKIILDTKKLLFSISNKNDIEIKIIKNKKPIFALANSFSLQEALTNVVENAIKYSHPKSKVVISYFEKNNFVYIKVKDFGIGIKKENIKNVFNPFFREDEARENSFNHSHGLGLTIASEIVNKHKGSIKLISKINKGTTVIIKILKFSKLSD